MLIWGLFGSPLGILGHLDGFWMILEPFQELFWGLKSRFLVTFQKNLGKLEFFENSTASGREARFGGSGGVNVELWET